MSTLPRCPLRRRHEQLLTPALATVLSTAPNPLVERTQPPERFVERHRRHVVELLDAGDDGEEAIRHRIQQLLDKCCVAQRLPEVGIPRRHRREPPAVHIELLAADHS